MADASANKLDSDKAVKFQECLSDSSISKHHPTQKYNRKDVKQRLVVESWLDDQLRQLYNCKSDQDKYPEIDLDDLLKLEFGFRRDFVKKILHDAPLQQSIDSFIDNLFAQITDLKPLS